MEYAATALIAAPAVTAGLAFLRRTPRWKGLASQGGALVTLFLSWWLAAGVLTGRTHLEWGGALRVDALSALLIALIGLVTTIAALASPRYLAGEQAHGAAGKGDLSGYYVWFHLFVATMFMVVTTDNLGLMWAAIEATTLASAFMVGFYRKPHALEAAWKYVILCTVGIALALLGTAVTYAAALKLAGSAPATLSWSRLAGLAQHLDPRLMKLAFILVVVGYGTKAGFAPLHTWLPDAHSQAPSPVSAMLSGVLLSCALYAILRFYALVNAAVGVGFAGNLLLGFGLFSMLVAVPFMALQTDLKRLLAYSSIEHVGVIAAGLGVGGPLGVAGALYHLFFHGIGKSLLFLSAGEVVRAYHTRRMHRVRGVLKRLPLPGVALLAGTLAITGTPPSALFVSEWSIVTAAFGRGKAWAGALFLAAVAVIFGALLYHVGRMVFGEPPAYLRARWAAGAREAAASAEAGATGWGPLEAFLAVFCLVALLAGGLFVPGPVWGVLTRIGRVLGVS
ncbi:MAG: hydrogenase 4 subunit F [Chitinophagales bacterium]